MDGSEGGMADMARDSRGGGRRVGSLGGRTDRAVSLRSRTSGAMSLRGGRDLSGDTNRGVRLNRRGRVLGLRGLGGWGSSGDLSRGHVAGRGRDDGGWEAGAELSGLDGLDRGGADGGLRNRSAVDEVSTVHLSGGYRAQVMGTSYCHLPRSRNRVASSPRGEEGR